MSIPAISWATVVATILIIMFVVPFVQNKLASR